jgi:hypothetical protein
MTQQDQIPRGIAIHEAGHAVSRWYTGTYFDLVVVRSPREQQEGPFIDDSGKSYDGGGFVLASRRYRSRYLLSGKTVRAIDMKPNSVIDPSDKNEILRPARERVQCEIEIMHDFAGPIAHAKYAHKSMIYMMFHGGYYDYMNACSLVDDYCRIKEERKSMMDRLEKQTRNIFRKPGVWNAVEALATALQEKRYIEWEEAVDIISMHTGEKDRPFDVVWPEHLKG